MHNANRALRRRARERFKSKATRGKDCPCMPAEVGKISVRSWNGSSRHVATGLSGPDLPPVPASTEFNRGRTGYVILDRLLRRLFRHKDALLRVLDRPEIPLNTNASENDIRAFVTKRKISGGTVSDRGRDARDIMLGLAKTCMKLKLSFYEFLGDRLGIPGAQIPHLAELIRPAPS